MMKLNPGAWIGLAAGLIGLSVAVAAATSAGSEGVYIAVAMVAIFALVFLLLYKLIFKGMINASRLQKTGLPGTARITEVKDTGVTINNSPQVKLTLEVKNSFGQRYTTYTRALVSRINPNAYMPGMEVPVKIDPKNEMNVVLDFTGASQASANASAYTQPQIDQLKSELEELQKNNEALLISGRPARAIVKKYTWLGVNVNGNNPYAELELEVLPEHSPSFSAKTKGVIGEAAVSKFQPGEEIFVKYDFYDNNKVVIEHS